MNKVQKFDFLIAGTLNGGPLRDEINHLYHAPEYDLPRFATERTLSIYTAAVGGNANLPGMGE